MDPYSGKTYTSAEVPYLPLMVRSRLVSIGGSDADVARVSRAVEHYSAITGTDKAKRRAANKAARKARRANR
jgi:hypothetical protein